MNGTGTPTSRDYDWERWRGRVDEWRSGVDDSLTTISDELKLVLQSLQAADLAKAGAVAEAEQRKSFLAWIAPSLPSLLSGITAGLALSVALMR